MAEWTSQFEVWKATRPIRQKKDELEESAFIAGWLAGQRIQQANLRNNLAGLLEMLCLEGTAKELVSIIEQARESD